MVCLPFRFRCGEMVKGVCVCVYVWCLYSICIIPTFRLVWKKCRLNAFRFCMHSKCEVNLTNFHTCLSVVIYRRRACVKDFHANCNGSTIFDARKHSLIYFVGKWKYRISVLEYINVDLCKVKSIEGWDHCI